MYDELRHLMMFSFLVIELLPLIIYCRCHGTWKYKELMRYNTFSPPFSSLLCKDLSL